MKNANEKIVANVIEAAIRDIKGVYNSYQDQSGDIVLILTDGSELLLTVKETKEGHKYPTWFTPCDSGLWCAECHERCMTCHPGTYETHHPKR